MHLPVHVMLRGLDVAPDPVVEDERQVTRQDLALLRVAGRELVAAVPRGRKGVVHDTVRVAVQGQLRAVHGVVGDGHGGEGLGGAVLDGHAVLAGQAHEHLRNQHYCSNQQVVNVGNTGSHQITGVKRHWAR